MCSSDLFLEDDGELAPQIVAPVVAEIDTVEQDSSLGGVVEARE